MASDLYVTEDTYGGLHLYLCNESRPTPLASWHGFKSYQDLADFLTFGLRGPAVDPLNMSVHPGAEPAIFEVVQPVGVNTDRSGEGLRVPSSPAPDPGGEVGAPEAFANHSSWCDTLVKPWIENWPCNCRN